ncbi:hypothetical protein [Nocardia tengchongensis]
MPSTWLTLPGKVRAEFDHLLLQGKHIRAIAAVRRSAAVEPKPSLHWLMDALGYRAKELKIDQ